MHYSKLINEGCALAYGGSMEIVRAKSNILADLIEIAKLGGYKPKQGMGEENAKNTGANGIEAGKGNIRQIQLEQQQL